MKRILKAGILGAAVSIFFTGCGSSALISGDRGYQEVAQDAMSADEDLSAWKKESDVLAEETTQAPDYYEENEKDKFENLSGPQAFWIKDGHSQDTDDIESFSVGALREDGTFLYCYESRIGEKDKNAKTDNRKKVHCAAAYNYNTKTFSVFHENEFSSAEDESFYMQVNSDGTGDIFVYDNGVGSLYSSDGVLKLQMQIGSFVRKNFKGYSVGATNAIADGSNRCYVNVFIEKESVEDMPEDAEESELDTKTLETVLVYDLQTYNNSIDQVNLKFKEQGEEWADMWDDQTLGSEPDREADWKKAVAKIPSQWGQAFLYQLSTEKNPMYIYQWKNGTSFGYDDKDAKKKYIPDFQPVENSYSEFTNLRNGMQREDFDGLFIIKDKHYYELTGKTGNDLGDGDYASSKFERTITITKSTTDENGNTDEKEEKIDQEIEKYEKRDVQMQDGYLEGYWILDNADSVLNVIDGNVFRLYENKVCWFNAKGDEKSLPIGSDAIAEVVKDNGDIYIIVSFNAQTQFYQLSDDRDSLTLRRIKQDAVRNTVKKVAYQQTEVDDTYHENHAQMSDNQDANAGMLLNSKNILHVTLNNVQQDSLQSIVDNEKITVPGTRDDLILSSKTGYLIASLTSGLLYLNRDTKQAVCLDAGTWYSVWRKGSSFAAVGFDNEQANYNTMDMVNARVKEFKLDDLYASALDAILDSAKAAETEESTEADEGVEQMQQDYNKKRENETVEFVKPENDQEVLDAWKDKNPGDVTAEKQKEKENAQNESKSKSESESASDAN